MLEVVAGYNTDVGIRKKMNQDSICLQMVENEGYTITMAVVCDGMGGLEQGEIASGTLIHEFKQWFDQRLPQLCEAGLSFNKVKEEWEELVLQTNELLIEYGRQQGKKLGTTVTAVFISDIYGMFVLHVGDCRLYELKQYIRQMTEDQTFVELQVKKGLITREQAKDDPRQNIILQCVGDTKQINLDMKLYPVKRDCTYVLCSDGFRHKISEEEMYTYLRPLELSTQDSIDKNIKDLVELCKERKEQDNISVIVIRTL
ncbi:MAG: protein phosphatase 2C domain-containing protein [bacterium]|nr:protein phosphatase 2C domain-containing protein [bacterium]